MTEEYRILIVDDDPTVITYLGDIFHEEGYDVIKEDKGNDALQSLLNESFHIAIIDVGMPDISGFSICKRIRNNQKTKGLPIILLSIEDDSSNRMEAWKSGANFFVNKPINKMEIVQIVENLINQKYEPMTLLDSFLGFGGRIESYAVVDLLQFMELGTKTGSIELLGLGKSAVVFFEMGTIVHAEAGRLKGSNAIYHIVSWQEGVFVYTPDAKPKEVTVRESLSHLLLEGVRLMDEEARDNVAVNELTDALLQVGTGEHADKRIEKISKKISRDEIKIFEILIIDMWSDDRKAILSFFIDSIVDFLGKEITVSKKHSAISSFARMDVTSKVSVEIVVSSGKRKFSLLWQVFLEQANALVLLVDPRIQESKRDGHELCKRLKELDGNVPIIVVSPVGEAVSGLEISSPKWFAVPEYYMVEIQKVIKYIFDFTESKIIEEVELRR